MTQQDNVRGSVPGTGGGPVLGTMGQPMAQQWPPQQPQPPQPEAFSRPPKPPRDVAGLVRRRRPVGLALLVIVAVIAGSLLWASSLRTEYADEVAARAPESATTVARHVLDAAIARDLTTLQANVAPGFAPEFASPGYTLETFLIGDPAAQQNIDLTLNYAIGNVAEDARATKIEVPIRLTYTFDAAEPHTVAGNQSMVLERVFLDSAGNADPGGAWPSPWRATSFHYLRTLPSGSGLEAEGNSSDLWTDRADYTCTEADIVRVQGKSAVQNNSLASWCVVDGENFHGASDEVRAFVGEHLNLLDGTPKELTGLSEPNLDLQVKSGRFYAGGPMLEQLVDVGGKSYVFTLAITDTSRTTAKYLLVGLTERTAQ